VSTPAAINGDRVEADRLVRQELDRVGAAEDAYSRAYREFPERFAARCP